MGALRGMRRKVCILASGGFDSGVLLADYLERGYEVHPFYVSSGFFWEKAELHWLRRFLKALKSPRLKPLTVAETPMGWIMGGHWSLTGKGVPSSRAAWDSVYLPGRNLLLLSQAGVYAATRGLPLVVLGVLRGNPFADSKPRFLMDMESAINDALRSRLKVEAPYTKLHKDGVARLAERLGKRFPLELTFSCLRPRGVDPCGKCSKCAERRAGLR
ncbi:MAG: 7-cyano-7-deazaguanine synthase [Elusimicrobia bacterium]|nr:7-cyano-7-deazaguanine synthase [Elusimicrobiota bacterium]